MKARFACVVLAAALLAACATTAPVRPAPGASAAAAAGTGQGPGRPASAVGAASAGAAGAGAQLPEPPNAASGATQALLTQSRDQREAGDLGRAAATVERALTIAPDDALLWVELAEIRMNQGDAALAEEIARKTLTLTAANSPVAERARRLLSR